MAELNWQNLRQWDGSQDAAFEELCCQLAAFESAPADSNFIRKGTPDAGVECFWILPNGDEWAWQAKFFTEIPDDGQWGQTEKSVLTALEKHPRLTKYIICMPLNRPDGRVVVKEQRNGQIRKRKNTSFLDKWNEYVNEWKKHAGSQNRNVSFEYWGTTEIFERLARREHQGRHFFWFNQEFFDPSWFERQLEKTIANAGDRYSLKYNVSLPIAKSFDALGRTADFYKLVDSLANQIETEYSEALRYKYSATAGTQSSELQPIIEPIIETLCEIKPNSIEDIPWQRLEEFSEKALLFIDDYLSAERQAANKKHDTTSISKVEPSDARVFHYSSYHLYQLRKVLDELNSLTQDIYAELSNNNTLLVVGQAGSGKTHLFCDIATQRNALELPTILLLGGQFTNQEPGLQIVQLLGLPPNITLDIFLGGLEAAAQTSKSKALILIDALNEGEGRKIWPQHLNGFLTTLAKCPNIRLAISVRDVYRDTILPNFPENSKVIEIEHEGFGSMTYKATDVYFNYFGIDKPTTPFLYNEFQNPLFLKLFCQALKNNHQSQIPPGLHGITTIFNFFIESINTKISRAKYLNYNPTRKLIRQAIEQLARVMVEKEADYLDELEAEAEVVKLFPTQQYTNSLFYYLIEEGLLNKGIVWNEKKEINIIQFSYQRFTDHLIAEHLLNNSLVSNKIVPSSNLGTKISNDLWRKWQAGLLEALAIQIPERVDLELTEVAPYCANYIEIQKAVIGSLVWRKPDTIKDTTLGFINKTLQENSKLNELYFNTLLMVALRPEHPCNARFLHTKLSAMTLPDRDNLWSIYLYKSYKNNEQSIIRQLLAWVWRFANGETLEEQVTELYGLTLAWFLTTSHRFVRDHATKALVALYQTRLSSLAKLLDKFWKVDDLYVLERLLAVAYGCAMRSKTAEAELEKLALNIYTNIFENGNPPIHFLLRDYARGVIEFAKYKGLDLPNIDMEKVRPPYQSEWPLFKPLTEEEIEQFKESQLAKHSDNKYRTGGLGRLVSSLLPSLLGDFSSYILGTNSWHFRWSKNSSEGNFTEIDPGQTEAEVEIKIVYISDFRQSLTHIQRAAWENFCIAEVIKNTNLRSAELVKQVFGDNEPQKVLEELEQIFLNTLDDTQLEQYMQNKASKLERNTRPDEVNPEFLRGWIFQKVLDLGWTVELFGEFDAYAARNDDAGRVTRKPERIGKKYQWLAYYEMLARIADNFGFIEESANDAFEKYDGPWQDFYRRDIDPSYLEFPNDTEEPEKPDTTTEEKWWLPVKYNAWKKEPNDNDKWVKDAEDLPNVQNLLTMIDPQDHSEWYMLASTFNWEQPIASGKKYPARVVRLNLDSFLVKKKDVQKVKDWFTEPHRNLRQTCIPEIRSISQVYLGELYWSIAHQYFQTYYQGAPEWSHKFDDEFPADILLTTERYTNNSSEYDCSVPSGGRQINVPVSEIVNKMGLLWKGEEGKYYDGTGKLVAWDPAVFTQAQPALLIRKEDFLKFLTDNQLQIIWAFSGYKTFSISHYAEREIYLDIKGVYHLTTSNKIKGDIGSFLFLPHLSNVANKIYHSFPVSQPAAPQAIEQIRQEWEDSMVEANQNLTVQISPIELPEYGIEAEWVRQAVTDTETPDKGVIFYFHGGGFNSGSCRTHRALAAHLAETTEMAVLLFDYKLAPEKPFPAVLEDAVKVYQWLLANNPSNLPIFFGGDSAGAGLALSTLVKLRDAGVTLPKAAFLISPWVDLALTGESIETLATVDRVVSKESLLHAAKLYLGETDPQHPLASPLYADLKGLPPLLIQVGSYEILLDDAQRLKEKAVQAGVETQLDVWKGLWHVWPGWIVDGLPEARRALDHIKDFITKFGVVIPHDSLQGKLNDLLAKGQANSDEENEED